MLCHCPGIHVVALTETWLSDNILDTEVSIPGYTLFRNDRTTKRGGGVAVAVKDSLNVVRRNDLESANVESVLIEILPKNKGILFGTFYCPPTDSNDFLELFNDSADSALPEGKEIIVTGDFNYDILPSRPTSETRRFKNVLKICNLIQLITEPTQITKDSSTLLDLLATTHPHNITKARVVESSFSDHDLVIAVRKISVNKQPLRTIECRDYASYSPERFFSDLGKASWDDVLREANVELSWSTWKRQFIDQAVETGESNYEGPPTACRRNTSRQPCLKLGLMVLIYPIKKAGLHNKEWSRKEMDESSQALSKTDVITLSRLQTCTTANYLLPMRNMALPSICLLWRVDIHILLLRYTRDWWRPYRLYSTEKKRPAVSIEVSAKVSELILDERHDRKIRRLARKCETRNADLSEDVPGCPSWTIRKQGAGELASIRTGCFSLWCTLQQNSPNFNPFTPKKVNFKFLLQPHQKYHIR